MNKSKKIKLQRWLIIIIMSVSLLITSGCQANNKTENGITKITFWHGINPPENRDIFNNLLAKFNESQEQIKVEALYIGQPDEQLPKILSAVVGGKPPNLLWYVPQLTGELVKFNAIIPLEEWLETSGLKAQIDPGMLETMELNGHFWSVPLATNNAAMFYRPSLFEKAGITETPKNWAELREVAGKLTKDTDGDGRPDQYGLLLSLGKGEWNVFVWLPFIFSAGGEIIQDNKPNLVNDGTIKTLQFANDLVNKDQVAILSAPERGYELDNFINGKVAMQITGPWTLAQLKQANIDYNVFPIPALETPAAVVGGENLFVFKTTPDAEAATQKFLEYLLGEEFQKNWALQTGYLPINIKAQQSPEYQANLQENPVLAVFLQQMQWARSRPIIPGYTKISENLGRAIEASLLGEKTPKTALEEAQKRLEIELYQ